MKKDKKPKYWIFVTDDTNWKIIKHRNIYGFNNRSKKYLDNLNEGDFIVMYIKGSKIGGLFKIKSLVCKSKLNFKSGVYPYKISLVKILIPKQMMNIKRIVQNISIFKGMKRWGGALMGKSVRELNRIDYFYIKEELKMG